MNSEKKYGILHEFLVILLVIVLLQCGAKIWPIPLALLLTLLIHGVRKLFRRKKPRRNTPPEQIPSPAVKPSATVSEQDLFALAFGLLQRRITERVTSAYPGAKWVWDRSGARERFASGEPLCIQLNQAGGYRTAVVQVHNLCFLGLQYLPQTAAEPEPEEEPEEPESTDYGLLAFEWVEANLQRLKGQMDEAKAKNQTGFRVPSEELPHGDSWPELCKALVSNGFDRAEPVADGILIQIKPDEKET